MHKTASDKRIVEVLLVRRLLLLFYNFLFWSVALGRVRQRPHGVVVRQQMSQEMPSRQLLQLPLVEELGLLQDFFLQEAFILRLGSFGVDNFPEFLGHRAAHITISV